MMWYKAIVNVSPEWGIGYNGNLLYSYREDLTHFKGLTKGNIVVYGRKTLETFPNKQPLKGRVNILLTHDKTKIPDSVKQSVNYYGSFMTVKGRDESVISGFTKVKDAVDDDVTTLIIINKAKLLEHVVNIIGGNRNVFIIGGESIYEQFLPKCDTVYVTKTSSYTQKDDMILCKEGTLIHPSADAFFPNLDEDGQWFTTSDCKGLSHDKPNIIYEFITYERCGL